MNTPAHLLGFLLATAALCAQAPGSEPAFLERGGMIQRELAGGQTHEYRILLRVGQYARVVVEQRTIDVAAASFGPDGRELAAADSGRIGDAETIGLIGAVSGSYRLRLTASERHAPAGRYEITLQEIDTATDRHRMNIAGERAFAEGMKLYRQGTRATMLKAVRYFEDALAHWRSAHEPSQEARALYTLGLLCIDIGDRQKALDYTRQALPVAQSSGDSKAIARALDSIGEVRNYFGDKRKAIEYYQEALPLMRAVGDRAGEAHTLSNLGVAFSAIGERRKAITCFEQASELFRGLQDRPMLAEVAGNMGVAYDNLGEYQRALESHQNELPLQRDLGDRSGEAVTLNNIGSAWSGLGEYQKALNAYNAALEINRSLDNRWNIAINLNNIAWVYDNLGERRRALRFYRKSLDLIRAIKDQRRLASTLNNIANLCADLGDYHKAVALHSEALALRRAVGDADGEANSLNNLGKAYVKLGEKEKAHQYFERALIIHGASGNRYMMARTLRNLGELHLKTGNAQDALTFLNEALEISRAIHDGSGEWAALAELARLARDSGDLTKAHERAEEALAVLESVRRGVASPSLRATLVASARGLQEMNIDVLMRMHKERPEAGFDAAALQASERSRARSFLELLAESGAGIRRGVDPSLLDRERNLERLISRKADQQMRILSGKHTAAEAAAAANELDALTTDLEQVQSRMREASPQYAALTKPAPLSLKAIQTEVLDDDTILLEYSLGAKRSFLWAATPSSAIAYALPPRGQIESAVGDVYKLLTARNRILPDETAAARISRVRKADQACFAAVTKASRMLLGPVALEIGNKRLLIVAEGILQYLPFAALPEPGAPMPLSVRHEIITVPSASVMAVIRREAKRRRPAEKAIAILADPVFSADDARVGRRNSPILSTPARDVQDLIRLRFSRHEAEEIARLAPAGATLKALDFDASRDTVLSPQFGQYRIIHFATHSLVDNERPELSAVVLSLVDRQGHPHNGFLRLYDIYNLRLNSDLVVLSACRTALGEEIKSEGLIGLTRGFLYAGAPRIVATLWEIDDRTTAEAMKRFYERMLARGERPAAALRAAQVSMWRTKGWNAPYYWAAFTFQGEWR